MAKQLLTNSRRETFQRCRREHFYNYELGRRPVKRAGALDFGTMIHAGLEQWWLGWQERAKGASLSPDDILALTQAGALAAYTGQADENSELDDYAWARCQEMLLGYHLRWSREMLEGMYEVVGVEWQFQSPLINPATGAASRTWMLGGKLDAVVRVVATGQKLMVEHKSASVDISPGSTYWTRLRIDGQVSTYYEGAKSLGHELDGCIYDVLKKPAQKPLMATPEENRKYRKTDGALYENQRLEDETPAEYQARVREAIAADFDGFYQRGFVVRLEDELREYAADAWVTAQGIRETQRTGGHTRSPNACERYGRFCSYFDVCTGSASITDDSRFRQSDVIHPELNVGGPKEGTTSP